MSTNELVLDSLDFAKSLAIQAKFKLPKFVNLDELISAAYFGLVDAANKYNGSVPFKNYAYVRINGEIKDYLRKEVKVSKFLVSSLENLLENS